MELKRKPLQGVSNIIRFNWHFYLISIAVFGTLISIRGYFPEYLQFLTTAAIGLAIVSIVISIFTSFYIYDLSDLYELNWIKNADNHNILNINAGFDETSEIIRCKFPSANLISCDFYDPDKHTEISIKRARKAYPPDPKIISVQTDILPFADNTFDSSLAILAAHEIRKENERVQFFRELNRITLPNGQIIVTEHLRDWPNFLAYTVGFMHFHTRKSWIKTFERADLIVTQQIKVTPFISTFILEKNGNTL